MLEVILEQKWHLQPMLLSMGYTATSPNQLDLIGKVVKVLGHIEEITKSISCDSASASMIIRTFHPWFTFDTREKR